MKTANPLFQHTHVHIHALTHMHRHSNTRTHMQTHKNACTHMHTREHAHTVAGEGHAVKTIKSSLRAFKKPTNALSILAD